MPHIFISTVALCANLYQCAPLIVGDKFSDPRIMRYLGAKVTTDYPEPNSAPMYVMFATLRSVLDALEEVGWGLQHVQAVQGYYTCIMYKRGDPEGKGDVGKDISTEEMKTASKSSQTLNLTKPASEGRIGVKKENSKGSATDTQKTNNDKATNTPNELDPESMENAPKQLYEQKPDVSTRSLNKKTGAISRTQAVSRGSDDELTDSSKEALPSIKKKPSFIGNTKEGMMNTTESNHTRKAPPPKSPSAVDDVMMERVMEVELMRTKSQVSHGKKLSHEKHKKKGVTGENKEVKKKPSYDKKNSSSLESDEGSPYAPKKINKVSKRESTASTVKEIFRD